MSADIITQWGDYELPFTQNKYHGPNDGPMTIHQPGTQNFLLTGIHAVRHWSSPGKMKAQDLYTGGLTTLLGKTLDAPTICRRRIGVFDEDDQVWQAVVDYIQAHRPRFILDIHACVNDCPWDMVFGTSTSLNLTDEQRAALMASRQIAQDNRLYHLMWGGPIHPGQGSMLQALRQQAEAVGLSHHTNPLIYAALPPYTITTLASGLGIPTIQVELRRDIRNPFDNPDEAIKTFTALKAAIQKLAKVM